MSWSNNSSSKLLEVWSWLIESPKVFFQGRWCLLLPVKVTLPPQRWPVIWPVLQTVWSAAGPTGPPAHTAVPPKPRKADRAANARCWRSPAKVKRVAARGLWKIHFMLTKVVTRIAACSETFSRIKSCFTHDVEKVGGVDWDCRHGVKPFSHRWDDETCSNRCITIVKSVLNQTCRPRAKETELLISVDQEKQYLNKISHSIQISDLILNKKKKTPVTC